MSANTEGGDWVPGLICTACAGTGYGEIDLARACSRCGGTGGVWMTNTERKVYEGRRKGGQTRTPARAAASRANGAKGGRPRTITLGGVVYGSNLTPQDKAQIMAEYRQRGAAR